jgi:hypothetical protein
MRTCCKSDHMFMVKCSGTETNTLLFLSTVAPDSLQDIFLIFVLLGDCRGGGGGLKFVLIRKCNGENL